MSLFLLYQLISICEILACTENTYLYLQVLLFQLQPCQVQPPKAIPQNLPDVLESAVDITCNGIYALKLNNVTIVYALLLIILTLWVTMQSCLMIFETRTTPSTCPALRMTFSQQLVTMN